MAEHAFRRTLSWLRPKLRVRVRAAGALLEAATTAIAFFGGLGLVALGVAMVYAPAGVIVGGAELTTMAVLYARGRG
jgi:hypothetical protein